MYVKRPDIIFLDISWVQPMEYTTRHFNGITVFTIIETLSSIPLYKDSSDIIYEMFETNCPEMIDSNWHFIEILVETISDQFYNELESVFELNNIRDPDSYIFNKWLGRYGVAMIDQYKLTSDSNAYLENDLLRSLDFNM